MQDLFRNRVLNQDSSYNQILRRCIGTHNENTGVGDIGQKIIYRQNTVGSYKEQCPDKYGIETLTTYHPVSSQGGNGHRHVGVTTVCPTYVDTGMFAGAAPPKTTTMLDPAQLAGKIVDAVEHRRVWVREPWIVKVTPLLKHGLPTPVADFLSDALGASSSMDHWQGRDSPGG